MTGDRGRGIAVLISITALWGISFPLVGETVDGRTQGQVLYFLFLRFGLATLGFLPIVRPLYRATKQAGPRAWGVAIVLGSTLFAGFYLQTWGLQHTTASRSAFVTMLSVPMVPLLAALKSRRAPSRVMMIGAGLATFGTGLVLAPEGTLQPNFGDALTLGSAFFFALEILLLEWATRRAPTSIIAAGQIFGVALLSGVACLIVPIDLPAEWPGLWTGVVVTGLVCTTLALGGMTWGQARVKAEVAAVIFALEPIFASLFVWLYLGVSMTLLQATGGAIVFGAVAWATRAPDPSQA